MRWIVLIEEASGATEPEVVVDAASWERALRLVADAPGGGFAGWSVELTPAGWKVVDPVSRTRYFLRAEDPTAGRTVSIVPPAVMPAAIPAPAAVPTDILVEVYAPKRALRVPRTSEITMRRAAPTADAPYTYVESGLLVPLGTDEDEAGAALRSAYEQIARGFAPGEAFRVVLGAFDEYFVGTPHTRAIAELDARSWQPPLRIQFPARRAATTGSVTPQARAAPVGGSLPPPARENPDVGPFSIPRTPEAAHAAAADMFLGPARPPSHTPSPPVVEPKLSSTPSAPEVRPRSVSPAPMRTQLITASGPLAPPPPLPPQEPVARTATIPRGRTLAGPLYANAPMAPAAQTVQTVRTSSSASVAPPPLPSHLASATVALDPEFLSGGHLVPVLSLWDAAQIRHFPTALDAIALLRSWLEHTSVVLSPRLAFVHCFDLTTADFITVASSGPGSDTTLGAHLKSSDPLLAAALRSSGLVDVPPVRARNAARYKTAMFSSTICIAMAGAGRVLGVVEFALEQPLDAERRREFDASVRALSLAVDKRGIHLDNPPGR